MCDCSKDSSRTTGGNCDMEKFKTGAAGLSGGIALGLFLADVFATGGVITGLLGASGVIFGVEAAEKSSHCK